MLKLAKTNRQQVGLRTQPRLSKQTVTLGATQTRSIQEYMFGDEITKDKTKVYRVTDTITTFRSRAGIVRLNREFDGNLLSPYFVNEVDRCVTSVALDNLPLSVMLATQKDEVFSFGTDFKSLSKMMSEGQEKKAGKYLNQIYRLQTNVAKLQVPVVSIAPGAALNSAAMLLITSGVTAPTETGYMAVNEVSLGLVPHSGATYYMSRLPSEFGTFMALTGLPITSGDMQTLGMADVVLREGLTYHRKFQNLYRNQDSVDWGYQPGDYQHFNETIWEEANEQYLYNKSLVDNKNRNRMARESQQETKNFEHFIKTGTPANAVAEADYYLREKMRARMQAYEEEGPLEGYLDRGKSDDNFAHIKLREEFAHNRHLVMQALEGSHNIQYDACQGVTMINRCFLSQSVEEIMENLEKEPSQFAKRCLEAMKKNDMLSMRLTLKLIREAQNSDYATCLRKEVDVLGNLLRHPNFQAGVKAASAVAPDSLSGHKWEKPAFIDQDLKDLDRFFEPQPLTENNVTVQAYKHAFWPVKEWYNDFNDQVLCWVNEHSPSQVNIREKMYKEIKFGLLEHGIDYRDKALTIKNAREHIAGKMGRIRSNKIYAERMRDFMLDPVLREGYYEKARQYAKEKTADRESFDKHIEKTINDHFIDALNKNLAHVHSKSEEVIQLNKRRFFAKLKKFLFKTRCFTDWRKMKERDHLRIQNYKLFTPHLTETVEQNYRTVPHPDWKKSPLWYLSKAVGRASLAPIELANDYLTNPSAKDSMTVFTLDKEELLKLRDDVFNNPQKWRHIFTEREPWDTDRQRRHSLRWNQDHKISGYDFWWFMYNDGNKTPRDSWPFKREYELYKLHFEDVEDKLQDTLKMVINQLLLAFEEGDQTQFPADEDKKLTKKQELEELYEALLKGSTKQDQERRKQKQTKKQQKIKLEKPKVTNIKTLFTAAVEKDETLRTLFTPITDAEGEVQEHKSLINIRANARQDLLKLVEIALLDKYSNDLKDAKSKSHLRERLDSLLSPTYSKNKEDPASKRLNFIDDILIEKIGAEAIQQIFDLVKPVFLRQQLSKLEELSTGLLKEFNFEETGQEMLLYFYLLKMYPQFRETRFAKFVGKLSTKRMMQEQFKNLMPELKDAQRERSLIRLWWEQANETIYQKPEMSVKKQIAKSMHQTKERLGDLKKWDKHREARHEELSADLQINKSNAEQDEYYDNAMNDETTHADRDYSDKMVKDTEQFLKDHAYEIENHFGPVEWLRVYSDAILSQDISFSKIMDDEDYTNPIEHSDDHWKKTAQVARYVVQVRDAAKKVENEYAADMEAYLMENEDLKLPSQQSIFQRQMDLRNEKVQIEKRAHHVDRHKIIQSEIVDFNEVQLARNQRIRRSNQIRALAKKAGPEVTRLVTQMLNNERTYINLEELQYLLETEPQNLVTNLPESLIDTETLLRDVKRGRGPTSISQQFLESPIDVVSLTQQTALAQDHYAISDLHRAQLKNLASHVNEHAKYVSNEQRQGISMREFLDSHHYSASGAYQEFADNLLKNKIESVLGKRQPTENANVDYEFSGIRTEPYDALNNNRDMQTEVNYQEKVMKGEEARLRFEDQERVYDNDELKRQTTETIRDHTFNEVMRDAKRLTALPGDMTAIKNLFENRLLHSLLDPVARQDGYKEQTAIVEEYMEARVRNCMLNPEFAGKVKHSENGQIYMKLLREKVLEELSLENDPQFTDLLYITRENIQKNYVYDTENQYNMRDISTPNALGYDNLEKRAVAQTADASYDAAHPHIMDKLLAEYHLKTRNEFVEANKLIKQLTDVFESGVDSESYQISNDRDLCYFKQKQELNKSMSKIPSQQMGKILTEMDVIVSQVLQKNKNGLNDELRVCGIEEYDSPHHWETQIPEFYDEMDPRKPINLYVDDKFKQIVAAIFDERQKQEKTMSRRELIAYDKVLSSQMTPEILGKKLRQAVEEDCRRAGIGNMLAGRANVVERDHEDLVKKAQISPMQEQNIFNNKIVDEDAWYKQQAMAAMHDKKMNKIEAIPDEIKTEQQEDDLYYDDHNFDRTYMRILQNDMQKPPRKINEADYEPKQLDFDPLDRYKSITQREIDRELMAKFGGDETIIPKDQV